MDREHEYYQVFPLVVPADQMTTITIRSPYDHCRFEDAKEYEVAYYPKEYWPNEHPKKEFAVRAQGSSLIIPYHFTGEQEHIFAVATQVNGTRKPIGTFSVYSLQRDLFERRPFKGDLHMHTYYSDGAESPAYVAASSRKIGLDFIAITDHHKYAPSLEALEAYSSTVVDLQMFPGEEVHPPECHTHIVNFGGSFSINELFEDRNWYQHEIKRVIEELGPLPPGIEPHEYASVFWCFEKVREAQGLGIFCHPHWVTDNRYNIPQPFLEYVFEKQPFDAFELLGGITPEDNNLQVAYYNEQRAHGKVIPIVGVSDAHGCHSRQNFGATYAMVFSPTLRLQDIISSINELYSVAIEAIPGENPRVYGPFRLVKYARFLLREYIPLHDRLCFAEGNHMLDFIRGSKDAAAWLEASQGQTKRLMDRLWAKGT
ncbi:MAG: hypothetical protein GX998_03800 [Firmicutes bacterium]|nr:hypothetical protein [Bacillota bacterium]